MAGTRIRSLMACLFYAGLAGHCAFGYWPDFGPFFPGNEPPRYRLSECGVIAEKGPVIRGWVKVRVYGSPSGTGPRVQAIVPEQDQLGIEIAITDSAGTPFVGPVVATDPWLQARPASIYCGDLNRDGKPDFAVPVGSGGNGLGAMAAELVVLLSSGPRYRIWVMPTMTPGPEDFLLLGGGYSCTIVKSSYVDNGAPTDSSRRHSYWVYNLVAVRGDELVPANDLDVRFPKWVCWAGSSNHKPVRSLSPAEKRRIWGTAGGPLFREATTGE
jgi:hypothetical protein